MVCDMPERWQTRMPCPAAAAGQLLLLYRIAAQLLRRRALPEQLPAPPAAAPAAARASRPAGRRVTASVRRRTERPR
jgi:hypothetical protein